MELKKKQLIDYYLGGMLIIVFKPLFMLVGKLLRRDHSLSPQGDIVILKLLGGGSLLLAMPVLLGIRRKFPNRQFHLITTPAILPFAEVMGLFDHIHLIDDTKGILKIFASSFKALRSVLFVDTFIDLEVYSRLSTLFSALSCARNRIGFYLQEAFWRKNIQTHLVFFNPYSGVYHHYEACAKLIGAPPASIEDCKNYLLEKLPCGYNSTQFPEKYIVAGHACSDLGQERMLSPDQWRKTFQHLFQKKFINVDNTVVFLGLPKDFALAESIIQEVKPVIKGKLLNMCGRYSLVESIQIISKAKYFVGIDSALLHFARLLGIPSTSYWGPTDPATRLKPIEGYREEVIYSKIPCSPCAHITEAIPCNGKAFCIANLFLEDSRETHYILAYGHDTYPN